MTHGAVEVSTDISLEGAPIGVIGTTLKLGTTAHALTTGLIRVSRGIGDYGTTRAPFRLNCDVKLMTVMSIRVPAMRTRCRCRLQEPSGALRVTVPVFRSRRAGRSCGDGRR